MSATSFVVAGSLCFGLLTTAVTAETEHGGHEAVARLERFLEAHPGTSALTDGERVSQIFGRAFSSGASAVESAARFREAHAGLFGVRAEDLAATGATAAAPHRQPIAFDAETGEYRFTAMYFAQQRDGIDVFRSRIVLLVRNEPGYPLVLASVDLRDIGDFTVDLDAAQGVDEALARASVRGRVRDDAVLTGLQPVVWAGADERLEAPRLAATFIVVEDQGDVETYEKRQYVVDAATGAMLFSESLVREVDVVGSVSAQVTQGDAADDCGPELTEPLPYLRVRIGATEAFSDVSGQFVIPNAGSSQVTVESSLEGQYFRIENQGGSNALLNQNVTPPGPADFLHNAANNSQLTRAEVNAYKHANLVRDYTLTYNPAYPAVYAQSGFPVNVNINQSCNAYYDGASINFYTSGSGCENTAFSTVVHHEYGHHLVAMAGSGQQAYGEGMSDVMGVLITDRPELGLGFSGGCNSPLRNADNDEQYPCGGGIHQCGRLLSGCVWDLREELLVTNPGSYRDILSGLAINAVLLHNGGSITPDIFIHYLTLDDDDSDIGNGTPHDAEIVAAFERHNMDVVYLHPVIFEYPDGRPQLATPGAPTTFRVNVIDVGGEAIPGSGMLHYTLDGENYISEPMVQINNNEYEATLPAEFCPAIYHFYFSADALFFGTVTDPIDAPATAYTAPVANAVIALQQYDFEQTTGWTVENEDLEGGEWEAGIPVAFGSPPFDFDGSGSCYVTGNAGRSDDVDGGPTYLLSPVLDIFDTSDPHLSYARWFTNDDEDADRLMVEVSNDGGTTWRIVEWVSHSEEGWVRQTIRIADYVGATDQFRMRFGAVDNPNNSSTEGGIDDVLIFDLDCGDVRFIPTGFQVRAGMLFSGTLESLFASDEDWVLVEQRPAVTPFAPVVEVQVDSVSTILDASLLRYSIESLVTATPPTVQRHVDLWNFDAGGWERVDDRITIGGEAVLDLYFDIDANRFIAAGSGDMSARMRWFDPGNLLLPAWGSGVDVVRWSVTAQ